MNARPSSGSGEPPLPAPRAAVDPHRSSTSHCPSPSPRCLEARRFGDVLRARSDAPRLDLSETLDRLVGGLPTSTRAADRLSLSAVVVVTHRDEDEWRPGLVLGRRVAEQWDVPLVLMRSGPVVGRAIRSSDIPATGAGLLVCDLTDDGLRGLADFLPRLASDGHDVTLRYRQGVDTALKRNGIEALGALAGWEVVLVLDDDMLCLPPAQMVGSRTGAPAPAESVVLRIDDGLAELASDRRMQAVVYSAVDYADHSVAGRARRAQDLADGMFAGGGATLQRVGSAAAFFPNVYNEDWLSMFGLLLAGDSHWPSPAFRFAGQMFQAPPAAAVTRERGRSEEIGDLIGEGLLGLFDRHLPDAVREMASTGPFWSNAVLERQRMLQELMMATCAEHDPMYRVLVAALAVYDHWDQTDLAARLATWVRAWDEDLNTWPHFLHRLESDATGSLETAIQKMGLGPYTHVAPVRTKWRRGLAVSA
jgi:hypothetical protein